jgi:hypothetical protein
MAYVEDFSTAQTTDPDSFILTDTSTGTDVLIVNRRIYLQLSDGTYLVPEGTTTSYIPFPLSGGASITLNVLNVDYAISIRVEWLNSLGVAIYSKTQSYDFTLHDEQFMYQLVQMFAANKALLQNTNFVDNCYELDMFVSFSVKSVETGNDITNAQFLLDLAQNMINNSTIYF